MACGTAGVIESKEARSERSETNKRNSIELPRQQLKSDATIRQKVVYRQIGDEVKERRVGGAHADKRRVQKFRRLVSIDKTVKPRCAREKNLH